jgi:hypothetical protein
MRISCICLLLAGTPLFADDDLFRERFADPTTRTAALAELIPGTRSAWFHTALDLQLAGRSEEFKKTMAAWKASTERKENPVSPKGMTVLENRQLLIDYQKKPEASLAELIRRLDLRFDDTRPDAAAAESLPTRLDPTLITEAAFDKAAAAQAPDKPYTQYLNHRLWRELDHVDTFDEAETRWFLANLKRADLPGVVPLVGRALALDFTLSFTGHPLLSKLTAAQLEALLKLQPELRAKESFDLAYLAKRRPGAETDFDHDPKAHANYLRRCLGFVLTLPPALNSLKAHVLFHHLRMQAELGIYPKEDFLAYLALPRAKHPLLLVPETPESAPIRLDADYAAVTACPPVTDDLPLIQSYLQHYLGLADSSKEFLPFIAETQLIALHARARLLAGANARYWGTLLGPAGFKALQDDARIGFAPGAPILLGSNAAVALTLDLKNTPDLLIRIYEFDLPAYLARNHTEPEVTIDLDGMVPHHERHLAFAQAPIVVHRESIKLPELAGPGAWLVDFTAGQVSARALIRKGRLIAYPERTATGQTVRVFDESLKPVTTATILLGSETFTADDASGRIVIPNAPDQALTRGIVQAGKLAAPIELASRADKLAIGARFHLDREQLLAGQETRLQLRVRLTNHGCELPLERIQEPALVLKAELLDGGTTERVIAGNLTLSPVLELQFQVPADLLKLTLTLRGTVTPATGGDPVKLSAETSYQLNGSLKEGRVATAFFCPTAAGHLLEVRGRNGEPLPSRAITLTCRRDDYLTDVKLLVRSDANGRVDLGNLDTLESLTASGTDVADTLYRPGSRLLHYASNLQLPTGHEIRLPLVKPAAAPDRTECSLMEETRAGNPLRDHFDKLSIAGGQLVIRDLPPGDYQLKQGDKSTMILISPGRETAGLLVSNTRILPLHSPFMPTIASASIENDGLRIQLRDHGPDTRVSLVGRRYNLGWYGGRAFFPFEPPVSNSLAPGFHGCGFLTDRRLSDEMRYILDRRALKTFPGSLLPRPGLLLNRWTEENLSQESLIGGKGDDGTGGASCFGSGSGMGKLFGLVPEAYTPNKHIVCDFLKTPAVVRFNLSPAADGSLKLPLADFAGCQCIEIVAADAFASDMLRLPLPPNETPLRDRRIARPLDPKAHHLATRSAAVLKQDAVATIENLLDADWRAFTTLADAHQFLYGITGDDRVREFVFLTEWPDLADEKKLDLLAKHACHEFHLFLARKDKPFFDQHVKPLLEGKPEPRFIDDLLLGRDLASYLRPYAWQRLNAAEKALLGQALPAARERIARELAQRWELEAPAPDAETALFTQTLRGSDLAITDTLGLAKRELQPQPDVAVSGVAYITEKLRRIIIPRIDFQDTTVEEAIDFLRLRCAELDTLELDPAKKGMNFVVRRPRNASGDPGDPGALRIKELRLSNVPLSVALKYICDQTHLRYKQDDFAVTLVPQTESGEDIFTRTFRVPPDFAPSLDSGGPADNTADPFTLPNEKPARPSGSKSIKELLREAGIDFAEGSSATLSNNGVLIVTNTPTELDKIESLTSALHRNPAPPPGAPVTAGGFTNGDNADLFETRNADAGADPSSAPEADAIAASAADPFATPESGGVKKLVARKPVAEFKPLFPNRTRLWREANYYKNTKPADETLIPLNRFWLDLAQWDGKGPFLSPHFNACSTTANEALMCLALLDLPFKAERPEVTVDGSTLRVKARAPMLLFYKDTRRTDKVAAESPLLVRQSFSPLAEPFLTVNGRQVESPVTGDFRPGVAYNSSLIVTNPTGGGRRIDVLAQIPAGSIPLQGQPATLSSTHEIKPYGVLMLDMAFYFPAAGEFAVYPLHVSEDGSVLAHTGQRVLRVTADPAPQDAASWLTLAAEGTYAGVLDRLRKDNLNTLDLNAIRWRLADRAFFLQVTQILRDRLHFSADVTSYGFHHNDVASIREYLENSDAVRQLGQWLDSGLLEIRPRVHHDWQTLEFDPLVNARAHRFGGESRLTHEAARAHYQALLDQLGWKSALDATDHLALAVFLFLQDRTDEALVRFDQVDPEKLPGRLPYDYLHAVALFHRGQPAEAAAIAAKVLPSLPPGLWRDRFQAVAGQAAEIAALDHPDGNAKTDVGSTAPQLDLALADGGKLVIKHRRLGKTTLRLFSVDLEVLFSKNPFLQGEGNHGAHPAIRPNETLEVPLAREVAETTIELPQALRNGNVLVAADAGATKLLKVLDSRAMDLRQLPQQRIVQVLDAATGKPLVKTYIKVYAETNGGAIMFHKDGYTDLRGMFDYLSHTGADLSTIKRLALLASHPEKGARTVIYER